MPGSDLGFSASAACHSSSSGLNNMERCLLLSSLFCLLFLRAECSSQLLPKPPQQLPEDFYTWLIVSVTEDNNTQPLLIQGQFAAYSSTQNFSCRYNEQNLITLSKERSADYCDYDAFVHYRLNDTRVDQKIECAGEYPLPQKKLAQLTWPREIQRGKFISIDKVGSLNCNHFIAFNVPINGKYYQVDVWVNEEDDEVPCQVSVFERGGTIHTTWAFDGFIKNIPDEAIACTSPRLVCARRDWTCQADRNATTDDIGAALQWVCNPSRVVCDILNPGGDLFLPNDVYSHADWAFNQWYEKRKFEEGELACFFGGVGKLVPPKDAPSRPTSDLPSSTVAKVEKRNVLETLLFKLQMVCDTSEGPAV